MKREYLVVYDYGMGGAWAFMWAEDEARIRETFPDLQIVAERPPWMSDEDEQHVREKMTLDIDDDSHPFLAALRGGRAAQE
jgi:hypothetical protein